MEAMFKEVTEAAGDKATREQLERIYQRYRWAADHCLGRDVAEVACGAGLGLALLRSVANSVKAGDIDEEIVHIAQKNAPPDVDVFRLNATSLPFENGSLDVLMMFEAIYYLDNAQNFFQEAKRVLRSGGKLLVVTVNPSVPGFHKSRFSNKYFSAEELRRLLEAEGFSFRLEVAWPIAKPSRANHLRQFLKIMAVRLGVMPQSKKIKQLLKLVFFGKLEVVPADISFAKVRYIAPKEIAMDSAVNSHLVLFVTATNAS
jgi:SAM-dependent methyltransferase